MIRPFYKGLIVGIFLQKNLKNIASALFTLLTRINNTKSEIVNETEFTIVLKIKNKDLFNEHFKKLPPYWVYLNKKGSIHYSLNNNEELINNLITNNTPLSIKELLDLKDSKGQYFITLDIPLLNDIFDFYIFINYKVDNKNYINIYTENDIIDPSDLYSQHFFNIKEEVIATSLKYGKNKTEYLTLHYNKFIRNQNIELTPELLLLNYTSLNENLKDSKLYIIKKNEIKEYSYTDFI
jgi:hypothetical protein